MSNRIDPPRWPSPRGPWPEARGLDRLYDHGRAWCVNAAAHPDLHDGYPDPHRHPVGECRGPEVLLDGEPVGMSVYIAAPFRFGQLREDAVPAIPRVVLEACSDEGDEPACRLGFRPGEALRLARTLMRLVDELTFAASLE